MLKVKFIADVHCPLGNWNKGAVDYIETDLAKEWVGAGLVEILNKPVEEVKTTPQGTIAKPEPEEKTETKQAPKKGRKPKSSY